MAGSVSSGDAALARGARVEARAIFEHDLEARARLQVRALPPGSGTTITLLPCWGRCT